MVRRINPVQDQALDNQTALIVRARTGISHRSEGERDNGLLSCFLDHLLSCLFTELPVY
jgi:hypothetical protein